MNETIRGVIIGVFLGIVLTLLCGIGIGRVAGVFENIRTAKEIESELRTGIDALREAREIDTDNLQTIGDLIELAKRDGTTITELQSTNTELERIQSEQRQALEIAKSASDEANDATREIREILTSGTNILDKLIEWAEKNGY